MSRLTIMFLFVPILVAILLVLNVLLARHRPDSEKVSAYECGLPRFLGQTRRPFSIRYYLVGILFLIFDLEILLLYPLRTTLYEVSLYGFCVRIIFFIVLTLGFAYELAKGRLNFAENSKPNNTPLKDLMYAVIIICFTQIQYWFIFTNHEVIELINNVSDIPVIFKYCFVFIGIFGIRKITYAIYVVTILLVLKKYINFTNYLLIYKFYMVQIQFTMLWLIRVFVCYSFDVSLGYFLLDSFTGFAIILSKVDYYNLFCKAISYSTNVFFTPLECQSIVPWHSTRDMLACKKILSEMFIYLINKNDPNLRVFCNKYYKPIIDNFLTGNTGIPTDTLNIEILRNNKITFKASEITNVFKIYQTKRLIYSFSTDETNKDTTYVGLTQNLISRYNGHKHALRSDRSNKLYSFVLIKNGFDNMNFNVHKVFTKFADRYIIEYSNNSIVPRDVTLIHNLFTEFVLGTYEQSIITELRPGLNTNQKTNFGNILNWKSNDTKYNLKFYSEPSTQTLIGSLNLQDFDFSLYNKFISNKNNILTDETLQWFVGLCEHRAKFHTHIHNHGLIFNSVNKIGLNYVKDIINISTTVSDSDDKKYRLIISNLDNNQLIASIFYKNIVTEKFLHTFNLITGRLTNKGISFNITVIGLDRINLDNGWLSGYIDGKSGFVSQQGYPQITIPSRSNPELLLKFQSLFNKGTIRRKTITFTGIERVTPIIEYLDKFPLKLNYNMQNWISKFIELRKESSSSFILEEHIKMRKTVQRIDYYGINILPETDDGLSDSSID